MALTDSDVFQLDDDIRRLRASVNVGKNAINDAIKIGTAIYQNANLLTIFPSSSTAYKAWLLNAQTAINNFINTFPAEPPLSG